MIEQSPAAFHAAKVFAACKPRCQCCGDLVKSTMTEDLCDVCYDEHVAEEEEWHDQNFSACSCAYCFCMNEVEGFGSCAGCLNGAHQG